MITLLITLIALVAIGFMWGGFIALLVTLITGILIYFTGIYVAGLIILIATVGSAIYKFKSK